MKSSMGSLFEPSIFKVRFEGDLIPGYILGTLTNLFLPWIHRESKVEMLVLLDSHDGYRYVVESLCHCGVPVSPIFRDSSFSTSCAELLLTIPLFGQVRVQCWHARCWSGTSRVPPCHLPDFSISQGFFDRGVSFYSVVSCFVVY